MKEKRYNRLQKLAVALALLLTSLLPSCSDDDSNSPDLPEDKLYTLTIQLQPSSSYTPVTKAEIYEPDNEYERRLEHWWLLIYGNEGLIEMVSDKTYTAYPSGENSETAVELKLPIGRYRLYALANLNSLQKGDELIKEIEEKKITEDELKGKYAELIGIDQFNTDESARKAIPMSSYATATTVAENKENKAEVELIRMLGKVHINVTNQTGSEIQLKSLSMGKFRKGPIDLLPYGQGPELPEAGPTFHNTPAGAQIEFNDHTVVEDGTEQLANAGTKQYSFYQYETGFAESQQDANKAFTINLDAGTKKLVNQEIDFDWMRRNDIVIIPITISNIETTLSWSGSRMPIGGLPVKKIYGTSDGIQVGTPFYCNADYAGDVTVDFELKSISGIEADAHLALKYAGETTIAGQKYCEAKLINNTNETNQTEGLLIEGSNNSVLNNNTTITLIHNDSEPLKGSFTVRTQELGKNSSAKIELRLIAQYDDPNDGTKKREVEIPYTIVIQNFKKTTN